MIIVGKNQSEIKGRPSTTVEKPLRALRSHRMIDKS
jgi:hypothetical protein